jgi:hypothetical protein
MSHIEATTSLEKNHRVLLWSLISLVVAIITGNGLFMLFLNDSGKYGDMFGFANALFTGLAFAGLFVSIMVQQKQIIALEIDAKDRRQTEKVSETLKQCQFYLTQLQKDFKDLSTTNQSIPNGFNFTINKEYLFQDFTYEGLKEFSSVQLNSIRKALIENPSELLLTLGKLEAFSANVLHGNIDVDLLRKIIGEDYCEWVYKLSGYIAFYRNNQNPRYSEHILSLYTQWINPLVSC